jgi:hypothetical protein
MPVSLEEQSKSTALISTKTSPTNFDSTIDVAKSSLAVASAFAATESRSDDTRFRSPTVDHLTAH